MGARPRARVGEIGRELAAAIRTRSTARAEGAARAALDVHTWDDPGIAELVGASAREVLGLLMTATRPPKAGQR